MAIRRRAIANGDAVRELIFGHGYNFLSFERASGIPEYAMRIGANYAGYVEQDYLDMACDFFGIPRGSLDAREEDIERFIEKFRKRNAKPCDSDKRKELLFRVYEQNGKSICNLAYMSSQTGIDAMTIEYAVGIPSWRTARIMAGSPVSFDELLKLSDCFCLSAGEAGAFYRKRPFIEVGKDVISEILEYACSIYGDSSDETLPKEYFWERSCLASGLDGIAVMPDNVGAVFEDARRRWKEILKERKEQTRRSAIDETSEDVTDD